MERKCNSMYVPTHRAAVLWLIRRTRDISRNKGKFAVGNSLLRDILSIRHGNRHGKAKEGSKDGNGELHCVIGKVKTWKYENMAM